MTCARRLLGGGACRLWKHPPCSEIDGIRLQGVDCQLAVETSGHGAFKENNMQDDGVYMALKVLIELARQGRDAELGDAIKDLAEVNQNSAHLYDVFV